VIRLLLLVFVFAVSAFSQDQDCLPCHAAQVSAFSKTGMGTSASTWRPFNGSAAHSLSGSRLQTVMRAGVMHHRVERNGLAAEYPIALAIGSGKVGQSYAVRIGDSLFQSPISWFSQGKRWGISPGFEPDRAPDFDRRITRECLMCHTSMASVTDPPKPISCEQCHARTSEHYANPAKLARAERDSVCESCHLQGEARVLAPGSSWDSPKPVSTTYVSADDASEFRVVSHVEQLARSSCSQASSGRLWCGSCHSPHGAAKNTSQVCTSCHSGALSARHPKSRKDCTSCHMPKRSTPEVAHTAYTDHRIRTPRAEQRTGSPSSLRPWRGPTSDRSLGLAYIYAGQRQSSAEWVQRGFAMLLSLPKSQRDAEVLAALGMVLLQKQRPKEASAMFAEAVRLEPKNANYQHNLGVSLVSAGETTAGLAQVQLATLLDPLSLQSWLFLARIQGRSALQPYLRYVPQSLAAREALQQR
jgi:tetratricopeptide (TPR) repeat protein